MKDIRNDRNDDLRNDDDQLRPNTMNEQIREASGGRDINQNELTATDEEIANTGEERSHGTHDHGIDQTQGVSYTPNDASGVRSGGVADMDDQTAGGAGLNTGVRKGLGSKVASTL